MAAAITDFCERPAETLHAWGAHGRETVVGALDDYLDAWDRLPAETMPPYFTSKDIMVNVPATALVRSRTRPREVERVERALSIVNAWKNNYCMWLSECLARLEGRMLA